MTAKDPYKDSPYDASGMPLGTTTADYDNHAEVAQNTVKDKFIEFPTNINEIDYKEAVIETEPEHTAEGYNSAIAENVNSAYPLDTDELDFMSQLDGDPEGPGASKADSVNKDKKTDAGTPTEAPAEATDGQTKDAPDA